MGGTLIHDVCNKILPDFLLDKIGMLEQEEVAEIEENIIEEESKEKEAIWCFHCLRPVDMGCFRRCPHCYTEMGRQ